MSFLKAIIVFLVFGFLTAAVRPSQEHKIRTDCSHRGGCIADWQPR